MVSSQAAGYIAALISILFFGSNFVPVKRCEIGDGIVFQFFMCNAIFITSFPVLTYQDFPPFHDLAMLGGFLWCTGNLMCGPIINLIGLSLGLLVWGSFNMLFGWASGAFGLFGLDVQSINDRMLNYFGVALALIGLRIFLMVGGKTTANNDEVDKVPLTDSILGEGLILMAMVTGALFGTSFNPSQYIIDNHYDGDDDYLNYVFPHYCGILIASWSYTILYFIYKEVRGEAPYVNPKSILPATVSGLMWGIACISWFYANGILGFTIAFPLITTGPGFIATLWGVLLFKEIVADRDLLLLGLAFVITIAAMVMIALSH